MNIERADDVPRWYVVHTNHRQEERAHNNLMALGVGTFHPRLRTPRYNQFTGVPTYVSQSLFPRYIFAKFNASRQLDRVCFSRGVHSVVSFGGQPVCVDEEIIELIHARMDSSGFVKVGEGFKRGDKVIITAGPMKDLTGIFERELDSNERVMILLTAITYQGRVVVNTDLVKKV